MAQLLFSYSHKDESFRDELEIHLSLLKREGIITAWHDRRIDAGSEIDNEISANLEASDIILLLVSPYFLDSDYCYDIELKRAIEKHNNGETKVIPVIINPCDWHHSLFSHLMAVPRDGKPITKFPNQHDAFLQITQEIRKVADKITPSNTIQNIQTTNIPANPNSSSIPLPRSSNLRIKKTFSDQEKDDFLENTFEYMSNYFEGSLEELSKRNSEIATKFRRIDANHFTVILYVAGKETSQCKIWIGGERFFGGGICYSTNISSNDNSLNDSISVKDDGYMLYLNAMNYSFGAGNTENLTQEGASEYFWEQLIRNLQY